METCQNCGKDYTRKSNAQKYCTKGCKNMAKNKLAYEREQGINELINELAEDEEFRSLIICM